MADRLTIKEKHKVQQMLDADEKTLSEISDEVGKSEGCINKYIAEELIPLLEKISRAKNDTENTNNITSEDIFLTDAIKEETIGLLGAAGVPEGAARTFISTQIEPGLASKIENANVLYKLCINHLNIHTTMINRTVGGKEGVTIQTQAASQIAEEAQKKAPVVSTRESHIFRPKG